MKPQHLEDVINSLKPVATPKAKVFVSMLAGIKISSLKEV
jgi:pyrroline-5-carboxylate reductase